MMTKQLATALMNGSVKSWPKYAPVMIKNTIMEVICELLELPYPKYPGNETLCGLTKASGFRLNRICNEMYLEFNES